MDKEALDYLLNACACSITENKKIIIKENQIQSNLFFLTRGLVRGFYLDENGNEITIRFINNKGWITHYSALLSKRPSKYTFQCLEESNIVKIPFEIIINGYDQFSSLQKLGRLIAENVLMSLQSRVESFQFLGAEQRYLEFLEKYPELFNRVSLSHLCTYLGIQRQSLSRIRKKIAGK
ncbi:MAG: Crp/Fnr family transcriptional regulator [Flavobacteriales bacterium]|nr:Crp/Fnr family transcriptional regulator [Flavobacteriales bacterium]